VFSGRIQESNSLFTYPDGMGYASFQDANFVPMFEQPTASTEEQEDILEACGLNAECQWDQQLTGDTVFSDLTRLGVVQRLDALNEVGDGIYYIL